jgi:hypothetical protein
MLLIILTPTEKCGEILLKNIIVTAIDRSGNESLQMITPIG